MIELENVAVKRGENVILDDVSFQMPGGQFVSIVGPNGAGKSTLIQVISGELSLSSGRVALAERELWTYPAGELATRRVVVPQATQLSFPFTVFEVVALGASVPEFGARRPDDAVKRALECVEMESFAGRIYTSLSGGERQRVHFARAWCQLAARPEPYAPALILLDEPTASLDLAHQLLLLDEGRRLAQEGHLVIAVLHDLNLASM
ncbi:MAG: ATP-binding cassette domain-containing protein, partial [Pseudomonadota bacterium]